MINLIGANLSFVAMCLFSELYRKDIHRNKWGTYRKVRWAFPMVKKG